MMAPMARKIFPTPEDAEAAFYDAFERCDLAAMLAVWASEDNIICIHPQGPRLTGMEAIRASWAEIFAGGPNFKLKVSEARMHHGQTLAVRTVYETMVAPGEQQSAPVFATNVFLLTPGGWRIIMHHASSSPPGTTAEEQAVARILH
jgi:uncharacterized protein (TIGR02246 family)